MQPYHVPFETFKYLHTCVGIADAATGLYLSRDLLVAGHIFKQEWRPFWKSFWGDSTERFWNPRNVDGKRKPEAQAQPAQTAVADEERLGKAKVEYAIAELERENNWQRDVHESEARNLQNEIEKRRQISSSFDTLRHRHLSAKSSIIPNSFYSAHPLSRTHSKRAFAHRASAKTIFLRPPTRIQSIQLCR